MKKLKNYLVASLCSASIIAGQACAVESGEDVNTDDDLGVVEGESSRLCKWTDNGNTFDVTMKDVSAAALSGCIVAGGVAAITAVGAGPACLAGATAGVNRALLSKGLYYVFSLSCGGTKYSRYKTESDGNGCYYRPGGRSKMCP